MASRANEPKSQQIPACFAIVASTPPAVRNIRVSVLSGCRSFWRVSVEQGSTECTKIRKSSIKLPLSNDLPSLISPPPFQRKKVIKLPPPSLMSPSPPLPSPFFLTTKLIINDTLYSCGLIRYGLFTC